MKNISIVLIHSGELNILLEKIEIIYEYNYLDLIIISNIKENEFSDKLINIKYTLIEKENIILNLNKAIEISNSNDLLIIDCNYRTITKDFIEKLYETAYKSKDIGIVGVSNLFNNNLVYSDGRIFISPFGIRQHHSNIRFYDAEVFRKDPVIEVDSVLNTIVYYKRECLDLVKSFDINYNTDIIYDDFCLLARKNGFNIVVNTEIKLNYLKNQDEINKYLEQNIKKNKIDYIYWKNKWGWDPEYPNLYKIRELWLETKLCWRIGKSIGYFWETTFPFVDILILTLNNLDLLKEGLNKLKETKYKNCKVFILNNGSSDGTKEFLEKFNKDEYPFEVIINHLPINIGSPAGRNWLAKQSNSPLIAFLDDDALVEPDWLNYLVEDLKQNPYIGLVGPKIINKDNSIQSADYRYYPIQTAHANEIDNGQFDYVSIVNHNCLCCTLYTRKAFENSGTFDIRYSPSQWEDPDNHIALRYAGYDILYDGRVNIKHMQVSGKNNSKLATSNSFFNYQKLLAKWGEDIFEIIEISLELDNFRNNFISNSYKKEFLRANKLYKEKKYFETELILLKLLETGYLREECLFILSSSLYYQEKYNECIEYLTECIELGLENKEIFNMIAKCLEINNEKEISDLYYKKAAEY